MVETMETEKLIVGYGKKEVVKGVEIQGKRGKVLCLMGANGSGKTTILRTLSGLLTPLEGAVYISGDEISSIDKKELAKEMAVVLTKRFDGGMMTAFEVVSMGRYPHTDFFGKLKDSDIEATKEAIRLVNAESLMHRYFDELSDGEKQKVLIARALVQESEIIILDEPTSHLDIRHRLELIEILKDLAREKNICIILSLHEIDIAIKTCDEILMIYDNKVVGYGPPEELIVDDIINDLFQVKDRNFNNLLGSVELYNDYPKLAFVIGGAARGTKIYRVLTKSGIGFTTGVIHENDVDYQVATTMGVELISEKSFSEISIEKLEKSKEIIDSYPLLIESDFEIGPINKGNLDLLRYALKEGKRVISLRSSKELELIYGDLAPGIKSFTSYSQMAEYIIDNFMDGVG